MVDPSPLVAHAGFYKGHPVFRGSYYSLYPSLQIACSGKGSGQHVDILKPLDKIQNPVAAAGRIRTRVYHSRALTTQLCPRLLIAKTVHRLHHTMTAHSRHLRHAACSSGSNARKRLLCGIRDIFYFWGLYITSYSN